MFLEFTIVHWLIECRIYKKSPWRVIVTVVVSVVVVIVIVIAVVVVVVVVVVSIFKVEAWYVQKSRLMPWKKWPLAALLPRHPMAAVFVDLELYFV